MWVVELSQDKTLHGNKINIVFLKLLISVVTLFNIYISFCCFNHGVVKVWFHITILKYALVKMLVNSYDNLCMKTKTKPKLEVNGTKLK